MSPSHRSVLEVRTAQGIRLHYPLAGPISRAIAVVVDMVIMVAIGLSLLLAVFLLALFAGLTGTGFILAYTGNLIGAGLSIAAFVIFFGYQMWREWRTNGQTPGKRMMGLRVMDVQGRRLAPQQVVLRNLLRIVDMMPGFYALGGIVALLSPRSQRLGDIVADTTVVNIRQARVQAVRERMVREENSLRGHTRVEAMIRQSVIPAQAALLAQAINRRRDIEEAARLGLYNELATDLRERAAIPAALADDLSDEQLIRNVLDILHRTRRDT